MELNIKEGVSFKILQITIVNIFQPKNFLAFLTFTSKFVFSVGFYFSTFHSTDIKRVCRVLLEFFYICWTIMVSIWNKTNSAYL